MKLRLRIFDEKRYENTFFLFKCSGKNNLKIFLFTGKLGRRDRESDRSASVLPGRSLGLSNEGGGHIHRHLTVPVLELHHDGAVVRGAVHVIAKNTKETQFK